MRDIDWTAYLLWGLGALICVWLLFTAVDCGCGTNISDQGTVMARTYQPAFWTQDWISDGKGGGYSSQTYHPAEWRVSVRTRAHGLISFSTSEKSYAIARDGAEVQAAWRAGKFSGGAYYGAIEEAK